MNFRDISTEEQSIYTLTENEQCVFFMLNRSGEVTFELAGQHAKAYIFALFLGKEDSYTLDIKQLHRAPHTTSQVITKSILHDQSTVAYTGLIHIDELAHESDASQESRALLLSPDARHTAIPSLEILPRDVTCHHKASAAPLNQESLFYLQSRGLNKDESTRMLIDGFIMSLLEDISSLGINDEQLTSLQKTISQKTHSLYA